MFHQLLVVYVIVALAVIDNCTAFFQKATLARRAIKSPSIALSSVIGKGDLTEILKEKTGLPKKDVESFLTAFTEAIKEEVLEGGKDIRIRDFGTFKQKRSESRVGRNPKTGENIQISGSTSVSFTVSTTLKKKDSDQKQQE